MIVTGQIFVFRVDRLTEMPFDQTSSDGSSSAYILAAQTPSDIVTRSSATRTRVSLLKVGVMWCSGGITSSSLRL